MEVCGIAAPFLCQLVNLRYVFRVSTSPHRNCLGVPLLHSMILLCLDFLISSWFPLHLFPSLPCYDNVPVATLPQTYTACRKKRPMPTRKHCCQECDYLNSTENILYVSIKLPSLLSLACQPCLAKNLVWPLANDFFCPWQLNFFFNPYN